jgi:hypothetical protein
MVDVYDLLAIAVVADRASLRRVAGATGEMPDVCGDNEAAAGDFVADEFGGSAFALGNANHFGGDEALAGCL